MSKMTLAWIENQIEQELERGNTPEAVRDLAALVTAKRHLCGDAAEMVTSDKHAGKMAHPREAGDEHLTRAEAERWVRNMMDDDGNRGGRWTLAEIRQYAGNFGVTGDDEIIDFYAAMNAMATDYGEVAKAHGVDNVDFYADMAKAFLHDRDAVQGKIKRYYEDIAEV